MLETPSQYAVPTSRYSYKELAEIYNQARVDYIVPMPMNAKRMEEYVSAYDIDLDASLVAIAEDDQQPNGICMLGVRDERTWITRLGVIPERRRRKSGQFLMEAEIEESLKRGKKFVQLEVIRGNEPAYQLFRKLGFEITRELMVIRRPPSPLTDWAQLSADTLVQAVMPDAIWELLAERQDQPAWTEESRSLKNAGKMQGYQVQLPTGENGWIIFQHSPFQLSHFVLSPHASPELMQALIACVHQQFPLQDTKIENVPIDAAAWAIYQRLGYVEAFGRIEMLLDLSRF